MQIDPQLLKERLIKAQQGDQLAYGDFLQQILPLIENKVKRKVFDKNDWQDLVQNILLSIHQSLATYDPNKEPIPWIATIAERRIIDYIRKYSRIHAHEQEAIEGDVTSYGVEAKTDIRGDLSDILEELPDSMKEPIELTKIEGLSTKEAADKLGIKENALRTRISRGLSILKKKFKEVE